MANEEIRNKKKAKRLPNIDAVFPKTKNTKMNWNLQFPGAAS